VVTKEVYDTLILSIDSPLDSWVLDSGASFHITASDSVWKLQKAKHVPELKGNLISMGQLDEEEHAISFHGGRWKASTGAKILARGYKTCTLYMTRNIRDTVNEAFGHRFGMNKTEKSLEVEKLLLMNRMCIRIGQV